MKRKEHIIGRFGTRSLHATGRRLGGDPARLGPANDRYSLAAESVSLDFATHRFENHRIETGIPFMEASMRALSLSLFLLACGILSSAAPARADWAQVPEVPTTQLFSLFASGDTIATGADTAAYVSTNGGFTWKRSARPTPGVGAITAVRVHRGRLYAGTFGQGVFVSDDLGTTWSAFNQGLVGGFADSQLDEVDFQVRGDSIYVATAGAGVYVRGLAAGSSWTPFGTQLEPNQASVVTGLAFGGGRLLTLAGSNGQVFFNDPGDPDWSVSNLDNVGLRPGGSAFTGKWNGTSWVVGSNFGVFRSAAAQEPWARTDVGFGTLTWTAFASLGSRFFGAFSTFTFAVVEESDDGGATWQNEEDFLGSFIHDLAVSGSTLYAARGDGLWRREAGAVAVDGNGPSRVSFALSGPQPFGDRARVRFVLASAGDATIAIFDVHGRRVGGVSGSWPAGSSEVALDATALPSGVYHALLTAGGERRSVRLVHVR